MALFRHCDSLQIHLRHQAAQHEQTARRTVIGGTNRPFDAMSPADLEGFRSAIAGIIRDILAAVYQKCPTILTDTIRQQWWVGRNRPSARSPGYLLGHAAIRLRKFKDEFVGYLESVSMPETQDEPSIDEHVEQLRELVLLFTDPIALEQAVGTLTRQKPVDWKNLCQWKSLSAIRRHLDALPPATKERRPPSRNLLSDLRTEPPRTILYRGKSLDGVTAKIWKIVEYLLRCPNNYTDVQDFVGTGKVWDDEKRTSQNKDNNDWIRVDSLLGATRRCFKNNGVPITVSRNLELRRVFMEPKQTETRLPAKKPSQKKAANPKASGKAVRSKEEI